MSPTKSPEDPKIFGGGVKGHDSTEGLDLGTFPCYKRSSLLTVSAKLYRDKKELPRAFATFQQLRS